MLAMPRAVIDGARICVGLAERSRIGPTVLRIDLREIANDDDGQAEGLDTLDAKAEFKKIDRELDVLLDLILKGGAAERINAKMVELEQRKKHLQETVTGAGDAPPLQIASYYRRQVEELQRALDEGDEMQNASHGSQGDPPLAHRSHHFDPGRRWRPDD
jgi:hypothetical protein